MRLSCPLPGRYRPRSKPGRQTPGFGTPRKPKPGRRHGESFGAGEEGGLDTEIGCRHAVSRPVSSLLLPRIAYAEVVSNCQRLRGRGCLARVCVSTVIRAGSQRGAPTLHSPRNAHKRQPRSLRNRSRASTPPSMQWGGGPCRRAARTKEITVKLASGEKAAASLRVNPPGSPRPRRCPRR